MEFIIQNIGWFVGIGLILLLAIIGYYADKKEQEDKENNTVDNSNNEISPTNTFEDIYSLNNMYESIDNASSNNQANYNQMVFESDNVLGNMWNSDVQNTSDINGANDFNSEIDNNKQDSENNLNNVNNDEFDNSSLSNGDNITSTNIVADEYNNFEDTHMTLEDLENKYYGDVLNDNLGVSLSDDGFVGDYSYGHEFDNEVLLNFSDDATIKTDSDNSIDEGNIDNFLSDGNVNLINMGTSDEIIDNNNRNNFELEVSENTNFTSTDENEIATELNEESSISSSLDLNDDSTYDDIWKF